MNTEQIREAIRTLEQLRSEGLISDEECKREKDQLLTQLRQAALSSVSKPAEGVAAQAEAVAMRGADLFATGGAGIDRQAAIQAMPPTQHLAQEPSRLAIAPSSADGFLTGGEAPASSSPSSGRLASFAVGQLLRQRYEIKKLLGRGGMGEVYLAQDHIRERPLALKRIHPHLARDPAVKSRFMHELHINEQLTHSGIVRTFSIDEDPALDALFFTMEYVDGESLEAKLLQAAKARRIPPIPIKESLAILASLADTLDYAHRKGIVHRDIKPANVMLTRKNEVKLMDFGIAKILQGQQPQFHTGFVGTVYYMAPEQMRGAEVKLTADIYSLGILMYQMLTGEIYQGGMPTPSALCGEIPSGVDAVFLKAIHWKPEERYQSASAMIAALRQAFQGTAHNYLDDIQSYMGRVLADPLAGAVLPRFLDGQIQPLSTVTAHEDWLTSCVFSADGRTLATTSWDHSVALWSAEGGERQVSLLGHEDAVEHSRFLADGRLLTLGRDRRLLQWDPQRGVLLQQAPLLLPGAAALCPLPERERILLFGWDGGLHEIDLAGTSIQSLSLTSHALLAGDLHLESRRYAAACEEAKLWIGVWPRSPQHLLSLSSPAVSLRWFPDGERLLVACEDGSLALWRPPQTSPDLHIRAHKGATNACAISSHGLMLLSGGEDGDIALWSAEDGRKLALGHAHRAPVTALAFSPDGSLIASVSRDRSLCLWKLPTS